MVVVLKEGNRSFSLQTFRQILSVVPEFYIHNWVKLDGHSDYSLIIDVPENFRETAEVLKAVLGLPKPVGTDASINSLGRRRWD